MQPHRSIVPLVSVTRDRSRLNLIGTGFLVGKRPTLVTARHVFDHVDPGEGEVAALAWARSDGMAAIRELLDVRKSEAYDLAVASGEGLAGAVSLTVALSRVPVNQDLLCYEFSSTEVVRAQDGALEARFEPYTWKGNAVRHYLDRDREQKATMYVETSFPALQGSSGAPLLRMPDYAVSGVIVANRERHLLPAQVVRVEERDGTVEEIKYFLPIGLALGIDALREVLDGVDDDIEFVA